MHVDEIMEKAKSCRIGTPVRDCARLMKEENVGFVPICEEDGKPVGAITDRDLAIRVLAEGKDAGERIDSVMTRDVVACRVGDDLRDAEQLMRDRKTSRIMVCDDDGKLQGVISLQDIAETMSEEEVGRTVQAVKSEGDQPHA